MRQSIPLLAYVLILFTQPACLLSPDDEREDSSIFGKCKSNEYVSNGGCKPCIEGSTNPAGDEIQGPDTQCTVDACFQALNLLCDQFNEAYIKASNPDREDNFGSSIALDGDTLVVGAIGESSQAQGINQNQQNNEAINSGAVYVFTKKDGEWSQQAYIKSSNSQRINFFGSQIALQGDRLVVSATAEKSNAIGINGDQNNTLARSSGAVYVFKRTNQTWIQEAYIKASNTNEDDAFGASLALDGDTLVVGATGEKSSAVGINGDQNDNSAPNSGAAYVFTNANGEWSQQAYLKASNTSIGDSFGASLTLDKDTLVVGAPGESSNASGVNGDQNNELLGLSGAVYVFTRDASNTWSQQAYIKASNPGEEDTFGDSISIDGNVLAVGAYGEDSNTTGVDGDQDNELAPASGAVYLFERNDSNIWSQQAYIKASNTEPGDYFGDSVSLDGDMLAVGAYGEASNAININGNQNDDSASNSGAVYVFKRKQGKWAQHLYIKPSKTFENLLFGTQVVLNQGRLLISADGNSSNATGLNGDEEDTSLLRSGAAYLRNILPN